VSIPDAINGGLELAGGLFIGLSCYKLWQDKIVRGISWLHMAFFAGWGYWNLYYYPQLDQWFSFAGGMVVVVTNTLWVMMAVYYMMEEKQNAL